MCYRVHDLDRQREKSAQQHTVDTSPPRLRLKEAWAALMMWLRGPAKPSSVKATSPSQPESTQAASKPLSHPLDRDSTGPSVSARAREREVETV